MADKPLLVFPEPEKASRSKGSGGPGHYHYPSHYRQGNRLSPIFTQLQHTFEARNVEIQQTTAGVDPEQVLVIETIGEIVNFANAVKKIRGLEWMGEIEVDGITPDEDFYDKKKLQKELTGRLYLMMSNQRALDEMLSLWGHYKNNPNLKFQRGLTKFKYVFLCLKDIRKWGIQDRLIESGIIEYWKESLEVDPERVIRFETELWFRNSTIKRNKSQQDIESLISDLGGQIINKCLIKDIGYHSLLAQLPASEIQNIITSQDTELVKFEGIMFFRPVGQMSVGDIPEEGELTEFNVEESPVPIKSPVVAVLDGIPLAHHELLVDRLIIDDPDDWAESYTAQERYHGTAMTSLVVNGDLNDSQLPLSSSVYVRPIMKPNPNDFNNTRKESMPDDQLAVDLIHRAVKRIFEGDNDEEPVAPTVKIVNLSIGDRSREFNQVMSPLSRLIDWLSIKYNVLFIISAGNHVSPIALNISTDEFNNLTSEEREAIIVKSILNDSRNRRILSPAESINCLTVGALHYDNSEIIYLGDRLDPFSNTYPSPISSLGSGYRRSIKPDILFSGGKQMYRLPLNSSDSVEISPAIFKSSPGNQVATPDNGGNLNKTIFTCGTSNATALVSRAGAICYESIIEIFESQHTDVNYQKYIPYLLKAMIVHGCRWGEIGQRIDEILDNTESGNIKKSWISRWLGNGVPDIDRVLYCTKQRATVIGFSELRDEEAHIFKLPLPPSFASKRGLRRITITLAWFSPISANTQKYRTSSLWFEVNNDILNTNRMNGDWRAVRRGTLQHEVFEGEVASPYSDGDFLEIKVNCRKDASKIIGSIGYGLFVTFEVGEGVDIEVYNEIRTRIATAVQIQQQV